MGIRYLCHTIVQYNKLYVQNNSFYTVIISKIRVKLPLIKFKEKNIIQGISKDFIDIIIFKSVMVILKCTKNVV